MSKALPQAKPASAVREPSRPRLIGPKDLPSLGINYSVSHLRRMWKAGKFPVPIYTSTRRFAWHVDVLDEWIASRVAKSVKKET
jgi:predicted DNA-binding transcriptional regulator AlpA